MTLSRLYWVEQTDCVTVPNRSFHVKVDNVFVTVSYGKGPADRPTYSLLPRGANRSGYAADSGERGARAGQLGWAVSYRGLRTYFEQDFGLMYTIVGIMIVRNT